MKAARAHVIEETSWIDHGLITSGDKNPQILKTWRRHDIISVHIQYQITIDKLANIWNV